jgi:hypothetical protein
LSSELQGLPRLVVGSLSRVGARALLDSVLTIKIDERIREQVLAETQGNPLALVELPKEMAAAQLAGGFGLPGAVAIPASAEEMYRRRTEALPPESRDLLVLAAAEPTGDPVLLWRAAGLLGIHATAAQPAVDAGLVEFGTRVRFRHPLTRSAAYQLASAAQRRRAHAALAEATDPAAADPDRRAWHRAEATEGVDEDVAGELQRSADRAQARGGLSAAAAFLERATLLTPDKARRTQRALAAAQAKVSAADFDVARDLLAIAEAGPLDEIGKARVMLIRAQLAFATSRGSDAPALLLAAAGRLEPIDAALARMTYLDAITAAVFAGRLAPPGADLATVAHAVRAAAPPPGTPGAADQLLDGLAADFSQEYAQGLPTLRKAVMTLGARPLTQQEVRLVLLAASAASGVWDDASWEVLTDRFVVFCREMGALADLPLALTSRAFLLLFTGDMAATESVVEELQTAIAAAGSSLAPYAALGLAAFRGREAEVSVLARFTLTDAAERGEGWGITAAEWASAVLYNGLGHHRKALAAAQRAAAHRDDLALRNWALAELVEAAARSGEAETAAGAYRQLAEMAEASGTDWALGVLARTRAQLAPQGKRATCTRSQSRASARSACVQSSPALACSMASGCGESGGAARRGHSCAGHTTC